MQHNDMRTNPLNPETFVTSMPKNMIRIKQLMDEGKADVIISIIKNTLETKNTALISRMTWSINRLLEESSDLKQLLDLLDKINKMNQQLAPNQILSMSDQYNRLIHECLKKDINQFNEITYLISERIPLQEICESLSNNMLGKLPDYSALMKGINLLSDANNFKKSFIMQLLNVACKGKNLFLLEAINNSFHDSYKLFVKNNKEFKELFDILNELEKIPTIEEKQIFCQFVREFEFGYIDAGGSLALAASSHGKPHINPTNLNEGQILDYFQTIATGPKPLYERFVVTGSHWLSGVIHVDGQGNASILVIDPKGDKVNLGKNEDRYYLTKQIVEQYSKCFPKQSIYLAADKRQNSSSGCSVFAVDDAIHACVVDNYLDKSKYPNGIFDFITQNIKGQTQIEGIDVNIASLPLPLLRTMQSTALLKAMKEEAIKEKAMHEKSTLNKKGDTPEKFANEQPEFVMRSTEKGETKLQNTRLENKQSKMVKRILKFLTENDQFTIRSEIKTHTLEGFKERITNTMLNIPKSIEHAGNENNPAHSEFSTKIIFNNLNINQDTPKILNHDETESLDKNQIAANISQQPSIKQHNLEQPDIQHPREALVNQSEEQSTRKRRDVI